MFLNNGYQPHLLSHLEKTCKGKDWKYWTYKREKVKISFIMISY